MPGSVNKKILLLEQEVDELEKELDEKYYQLGREVYEASERGVEEIGRLVDKMVESRLKLATLKGAVSCPHCLTDNPIDSAYCRGCGKPVEADG